MLARRLHAIFTRATKRSALPSARGVESERICVVCCSVRPARQRRVPPTDGLRWVTQPKETYRSAQLDGAVADHLLQGTKQLIIDGNTQRVNAECYRNAGI